MGGNKEQLKRDLKALIIRECDRDVSIDDITDEESLFGRESPLQLDSMDGLQLSVALEHNYGVKITDSKELRRVFQSVNSLVAFLESR